MNARSETPSLPAFLERRRRDLPMSLAFAAARGPFRVWAERLGTLWRAELPECDTPAEGRCDGQGVTLDYATGAQAEGVFLRPSGPGPHPAILLLHEHGGSFDCGWEKMLDLPASQETRARLYEGRAPAQPWCVSRTERAVRRTREEVVRPSTAAVPSSISSASKAHSRMRCTPRIPPSRTDSVTCV